MKTLAAVVLIVLALAGAATFLLTTTTGLRWTVHEALIRTGTPVEIGTLRGRLAGPLSLRDVSYRDAESGTRVRIDALELDWQPLALLRGLAHVTRLQVSGVEVVPGSSGDESDAGETALPRIRLPLAVRVDELRLDGLAVAGGDGAPAAVVERASLSGSIDAGEALLTGIAIDAGRYSVAGGRIRVALEADMPLEASLDWRAAPPDLPAFRGSLQVGGALGGTIEPAFEVTAPFAASGRGTLDNLLDEPRWTLAVTLPRHVALDTVMDRLPPIAVQGRIRAEGDTARARVMPDLALAYRDLEAVLDGETDISADAVVINRAQLARPDGSDTLRLSGRYAFSGDWTLSATIPEPLALDGVPGELPPVAVRGDIRAEGDHGRARVRPDVVLAYDGMQTTVEGEADVTPEAVEVRRARLGRPDAADTVHLSGRVGFADALPFALQGRWESLRGPGESAWSSRSGEFQAQGDRRALEASVSGTVTPPGQDDESPVELDLRASGLDTEPEITGSARLPYFGFRGVAARELAADIELRLAGDAPSQVQVTAAELRAGGRTATDVTLRADGTPGRHEAALRGTLDGWAVETAVAGSYEENRWTGSIERLTAASPEASNAGRWVLTQPVPAAWSPSRTEIDELCLRSESTELCANGYFAGGDDWHASAGLSGLGLARLAVNAPDALRIDGALTAQAEVGDSGVGIAGEARVAVDRATIAWQGDNPVTTDYRDVALEATLSPDALRATLTGKVDESGSIEGELVTRDPLAGDGALSGSVSARLPSLRLIQAAVPALGLSEGKARLSLTVDGTRSAPRLGGDARIEEAVLDVAPLGIQLSALNLEVTSDDSRRLAIEGRAESGEGTLTASGHMAWPQDGGWRADVEVGGDQAELARLPKALIVGSPDLRLSADESGGTVEGRVLITRAELTPEAGRPQVTLSEDIVVKGEESGNGGARNPMAWHARVTVELGDEVRFRGYGLQGRLSGAIEVDAPPQQPPRANGSIQIHDGEYSLYGRTFNIQRGRVVYTGGPIDNPGIDVEVVKKVRDVNVSMALSGPLVDPSLALTSTPAMSDTDKMSYLLLGRPASEASGAEAGLLLRAAASLIPGGGRGVPSYVQSTLGLDTLELRSETAETEGAAVELGKYLAPDLYVSYIAGFQQAVDIFRVRYELARHWLLQAESTTSGSGGDLLFTW